MTMECFRIDESGYTGFDLLNRDQRFQGAAAIAIGNDDAARLIKEHFPRLQASELKCGALSRRSGNYPHATVFYRAGSGITIRPKAALQQGRDSTGVLRIPPPTPRPLCLREDLSKRL